MSPSQPSHSLVDFGYSILKKKKQPKTKKPTLVYSVCSASKQQRRNDGFNILIIIFSLISRTVTHGSSFYYITFLKKVSSTVLEIPAESVNVVVIKGS